MDNHGKEHTKQGPTPPSSPPGRNRFSRNIFLLIIAFVAIISIFNLVRIGSTQEEQKVTYSNFVAMVETGQVDKVTIKGNSLEADYQGSLFTTYAPDDPGLVQFLMSNNVEIEAVPQNDGWWVGLLGGVLPIIIFIGIWFWIFRQMQTSGNRALSFGKSRAKVAPTDKMKVTFEDVAGAEEAKEEVKKKTE